MITSLLIRLFVVVLGTIFLFVVSYKSIKDLKSHGFYRFFVFESILIIVVINLPYWFKDPFSLRQIFSWIFLFISIYLVYQSFTLLKKIGGAGERKDFNANYKFENTTNLISNGIYKYIRHPMYSSLLFLCVGSLFKNLSGEAIIISFIAVIFLILTAKFEEKENIKFFGEEYILYIRRTKMFVPFLF